MTYLRTIIGLMEMPSDIQEHQEHQEHREHQEHATGPFPGGYPNMRCKCAFPGESVVGSGSGELGVCHVCTMIRCRLATVGGGRWKV